MVDVPAATSTGSRVEHRLPSDPASVASARTFAREAAHGRLSAEACADLELLMSEVVTNAVRHGGGTHVDLVLELDDVDGLQVQVIDGGAGFVPVPRAMTADDEGGFGLYLVERLTRRWGMTREHGRTRVWFELRGA